MRSLLRFSAAALLGLAPTVVGAQLTIDRETVVLNPAQPGERSADIVVRNAGETGVQAAVMLEDWDVDASGASRWRKAGQVAGSCGDRVSVSPRVLTLAPGEQRVVRIALKTDARFDAECWSAAVVQQTNTRHANANANVNVNADTTTRSTVPLYVTPSGLATDGEVSDVVVRHDSLEVTYNNTGKLRTDVAGEVQIRLPNDSLVAVIPLDAATVLTGSTRKWRVPMPKLPAGKYTLFAVADFGGPALTAAQAALEIR